MDSCKHKVLYVVAVVMWFYIADAAGQPPNASTDIQAAKAAWQRRHDRVHSLRATFTEESTVHRESYLVGANRALAQARAKLGAAAEAIPDADYLIAFASIVTIKGDDYFKYSYTGKRWSPHTRQFEPIEYYAISNPEDRIFFDRRPDSDRPPSVSVSDSRLSSDEGALTLGPLMLAVRSGSPSRRKLADYTVTGQTVTVEGRACVELLRGSRAEGNEDYLYLDPGRDWVVRRIDGYSDGKLTKRISAEYTADPVAGWLPSAWSYVIRSAEGKALESGKVTVHQYEINTDIPDDEFRPKYPPGTFVVRDTKGKGTVSVVKSDGSPGVGVSLAQRPSYDHLVQANRAERRQRIWLLAIVGAVMAVTAIVVVRWRRKRAADADATGLASGPTVPGA